jgi:hypothetical protein
VPTRASKIGADCTPYKGGILLKGLLGTEATHTTCISEILGVGWNTFEGRMPACPAGGSVLNFNAAISAPRSTF